jgi:hypothetical protein
MFILKGNTEEELEEYTEIFENIEEFRGDSKSNKPINDDDDDEDDDDGMILFWDFLRLFYF